jgi:hypothetical protein
VRSNDNSPRLKIEDPAPMREYAIAMGTVHKKFGKDFNFIKRNLDKEASDSAKMVVQRRRFTSTT